jgi:phenylpyruvate tautomerase PptA (4-oxalocrotonate tautomerase family)
LSADPTKTDELRRVIAEKLTALFLEMQDASWKTEDIVAAIQAVMKERWIADAAALREAREKAPKNFVSDGNEG